jgi:hypothetical protein
MGGAGGLGVICTLMEACRNRVVTQKQPVNTQITTGMKGRYSRALMPSL